MATSPYAIRSDLLQIAIAYQNEALIADRVAPYSPVDAEIFDWYEYDKREEFTITDDEVGRYTPPNEIVFSAEIKTDRTVDRGLSSPIPYKDVYNARTTRRLVQPIGHAIEQVMKRVLLNREKRVADTVFNLNTYLPNLRETLSGTDRWLNSASKPKDQINAALDSDDLLCRPTHLVLGAKAWTALKQNPQIVESVVATGAKEGNAQQRAVAELFELEGLIVGRSRRDDANPGAPMNLTRLWGNHAALIAINPLARTDTAQEPTFMLTARFGERIAMSKDDDDIGLYGGVRVKAGESVKELVISQHCGYFFQNVA